MRLGAVFFAALTASGLLEAVAFKTTRNLTVEAGLDPATARVDHARPPAQAQAASASLQKLDYLLEQLIFAEAKRQELANKASEGKRINEKAVAEEAQAAAKKLKQIFAASLDGKPYRLHYYLDYSRRTKKFNIVKVKSLTSDDEFSARGGPLVTIRPVNDKRDLGDESVQSGTVLPQRRCLPYEERGSVSDWPCKGDWFDMGDFKWDSVPVLKPPRFNDFEGANPRKFRTSFSTAKTWGGDGFYGKFETVYQVEQVEWAKTWRPQAKTAASRPDATPAPEVEVEVEVGPEDEVGKEADAAIQPQQTLTTVVRENAEENVTLFPKTTTTTFYVPSVTESADDEEQDGQQLTPSEAAASAEETQAAEARPQAGNDIETRLDAEVTGEAPEQPSPEATSTPPAESAVSTDERLTDAEESASSADPAEAAEATEAPEPTTAAESAAEADDQITSITPADTESAAEADQEPAPEATPGTTTSAEGSGSTTEAEDTPGTLASTVSEAEPVSTVADRDAGNEALEISPTTTANANAADEPEPAVSQTDDSFESAAEITFTTQEPPVDETEPAAPETGAKEGSDAVQATSAPDAESSAAENEADVSLNIPPAKTTAPESETEAETQNNIDPPQETATTEAADVDESQPSPTLAEEIIDTSSVAEESPSSSPPSSSATTEEVADPEETLAVGDSSKSTQLADDGETSSTETLSTISPADFLTEVLDTETAAPAVTEAPESSEAESPVASSEVTSEGTDDTATSALEVEDGLATPSPAPTTRKTATPEAEVESEPVLDAQASSTVVDAEDPEEGSPTSSIEEVAASASLTPAASESSSVVESESDIATASLEDAGPAAASASLDSAPSSSLVEPVGDVEADAPTSSLEDVASASVSVASASSSAVNEDAQDIPSSEEVASTSAPAPAPARVAPEEAISTSVEETADATASPDTVSRSAAERPAAEDDAQDIPTSSVEDATPASAPVVDTTSSALEPADEDLSTSLREDDASSAFSPDTEPSSIALSPEYATGFPETVTVEPLITSSSFIIYTEAERIEKTSQITSEDDAEATSHLFEDDDDAEATSSFIDDDEDAFRVAFHVKRAAPTDEVTITATATATTTTTESVRLSPSQGGAPPPGARAITTVATVIPHVTSYVVPAKTISHRVKHAGRPDATFNVVFGERTIRHPPRARKTRWPRPTAVAV